MMSRKGEYGHGASASDEVRELERELRGIVIEERCSFGPELRSDLAREYRRLGSGARQSASWVRPIGIAAGVVVALGGGALTVPQMRAVLLNGPGISPALDSPSSPPPFVSAEPEFPATDPMPVLPAPATAVADPGGSVVVEQSALAETVPVRRDLDQARRIVAEEIPALPDRREGWGTVELLIWVSPDGRVEFPQIDRSSGFAELDRAALRAIRSFEFEPAMRRGVAVGTWVRFPIGFRPESARILLDAEAETLSGSGSN